MSVKKQKERNLEISVNTILCEEAIIFTRIALVFKFSFSSSIIENTSLKNIKVYLYLYLNRYISIS